MLCRAMARLNIRHTPGWRGVFISIWHIVRAPWTDWQAPGISFGGLRMIGPCAFEVHLETGPPLGQVETRQERTCESEGTLRQDTSWRWVAVDSRWSRITRCSTI